MTYPTVLSEFDTLLQMTSGKSIARYGDGELRAALGRGCISQVDDPKMAAELKAILRDEVPGLLVGIPNTYSDTPKRESWLRFSSPGFTTLYTRSSYASSFITRPDSAPWIDTEEYWSKVGDLWKGRDVTLVVGDEKSLRAQDLTGATSVRTVWGPERDAYASIDALEKIIGRPDGPVLMCLGCTATVLAARLHQKGVWAMDVGHIGMFMRCQGIYRMSMDDIASPAYRDTIREMHKTVKWGGKGGRHVGAVRDLIEHVSDVTGKKLEKCTVLDYGCGRGSMAEALKPHRCQQFDPGVKGKDVLPKPSDIVVCTDVLEHIEHDKLDNVLNHIEKLTREYAFFVISTRPANAVLPDGRNAHLIVETPDWWMERIMRSGKWAVLDEVRSGDATCKELRVKLRRVQSPL
jgi:hypothetical protein